MKGQLKKLFKKKRRKKNNIEVITDSDSVIIKISYTKRQDRFRKCSGILCIITGL